MRAHSKVRVSPFVGVLFQEEETTQLDSLASTEMKTITSPLIVRVHRVLACRAASPGQA